MFTELMHITTYDNILLSLSLPYTDIYPCFTICTCHHITVRANNQRNLRACRSTDFGRYENFTQIVPVILK
jgi:hypothetical protein